MKTCNLCGAEKPLDDFMPGGKGADGRSGRCRACTLEGLRVVRERRRAEAAERLVLAGGKVCRMCQQRVPVRLFDAREASIDGLESWCRPCYRARHALRSEDPEYRARKAAAAVRAYWRDPEKYRGRSREYRIRNPEKVVQIAAGRNRANNWAGALASSCNRKRILDRFGAPDIDEAHVVELFERQGGRCYWLDIPLVVGNGFRDPRRPSLDRLDNNAGYVVGNVVLSCMFANLGRSALDAASFRKFVDELRETLSRKYA